MSSYPYADRFAIHRSLPEVGLSREEVLDQLHTMAKEEDTFWEGGKVSGTMYCGGPRPLQLHERGLPGCSPVASTSSSATSARSATSSEAEIISMVLDLHHGEAAAGGGRRPLRAGDERRDGAASPHAVLAYREHARPKPAAWPRPNVIKPETAHPAFDKACHLFGVELRKAPVHPDTTQVDLDWVRDHMDGDTVALVGSACNSWLRHCRSHRRGSAHWHSKRGCRPARRRLSGQRKPSLRPGTGATTYPLFDHCLPGVTSILGRHSQVRLRAQGVVGGHLQHHKEPVISQYFYLTDWSSGKYTSPGMDGFTLRRWHHRRHLGRPWSRSATPGT